MLRRLALALLALTTAAFSQTNLAVTATGATATAPSEVVLNWAASTTAGTTITVSRAPGACVTGQTFSTLASGVAAGGPYTDVTVAAGSSYCYYVQSVLAGFVSSPSNSVSALVPPAVCSYFSSSDPGQAIFCDGTPACVLSAAATSTTPGSSTLCRSNGILQISENGSSFRQLFNAPVDVFKFVAPTNIVVSPTTTYYLGSLVALGHNPDMVYLAPNACSLNRVVYDARMSGGLSTPITIQMWDITQGIAIPNSAVTQTWTGVTVESVASPSFPVNANDQLQVRFFMPAGVPSGFYINMTVTAYCTDN